MVDVLNKKVLREIKANYKQYLAVIIIACLAVTLFNGIYANYRGFRYKVDNIYETANACDGIVLSTTYDEDIINYLEDNNIEYEKRHYINAKGNNKPIILASFNDESTFNVPSITSLGNISENDFLVPKRYLEDNKLNINDEINISLTLLNYEINLNIKITGTMTHLEALDSSTYNATFMYIGEGVIKKAIKEKVPLLTDNLINSLLESNKNSYLIKADNIDEVLNDIKEQNDVLYALKLKDLPSNITIESDINNAKNLLYIFPIIFYLVAVLIILTSLSQLINNEIKNIGLLGALGYNRHEILAHYSKIFIILTLIGSVLGAILGPIIIPRVLDQKYNILYALPDIKTPIFYSLYLVGPLLIIFVTLINSLLATKDSLKLKPSESLRGANSYKMKFTTFDKIYKNYDKATNFRMALRNMKRKISRPIMVFVGVAGCASLLLAGFGIEDTLDNSIATERNLIPFNISVSYLDSSSKYDDIIKIENVEEVSEYARIQTTLTSDAVINSYVYILPLESNILNVDYNDNSVLISSKVASSLGLAAGDKVSFSYGNNSYSLIITDVVDFSFSQGIFISCANYKELYKPTNAWIKTKDKKFDDKVLEEILLIDNILQGQTIDSTMEMANNTLGSIKVMTNTIKVFAIMLALVVLYNLALLNFKERTKDIATLKVLGFNKIEIASSFLIEILSLTILGSLFGLLLGYPLMFSILKINENPLLSYIYKIDVSSYLYTILITAGSSLIINLIISRFTSKIKMSESLKAVD